MVAPKSRFRGGEAAPAKPAALDSFTHRVLLVIGLAVLAVLVLAMVWYTMWVWLVAFAGILLAVFLRALTIGVRKVTRLPDGGSLLIVCLALIGATAGSFLLLAPRVAEQINEMRTTLPGAIETLVEQMEQYQWGAFMTGAIQDIELDEFQQQIAVGAAAMLANAVTAVVAVVVVIFLGIYIAANPKMYIEGTLRLFTPMRRPRLRQVFYLTGTVLMWWLLGRIVAMAFVGVATALGLWLLGVPLAFTLGLIAGVLDFIPNVGPILAAAPAVLIAFSETPRMALYVVILYFVIQQVESYVVTPLVQEKAVKLPPALTVFVQVLFFVMAGFIGLLLAGPIAAAGLVIVRELYVKDTLLEEDDEDLPHPETSKRPNVQTSKLSAASRRV